MQYVVCHRSISGEYDHQFQTVQIETWVANLIIKTTIQQEGNFALTSQTFVGHVNLILSNSQAPIFWISVGDWVQNPWIESIEALPRYTIAVREQTVCVRGWRRMIAMEKIVEMINLPLKYWHVEGLSFSGLDQF